LPTFCPRPNRRPGGEPGGLAPRRQLVCFARWL
jgi:hypothetical protein